MAVWVKERETRLGEARRRVGKIGSQRSSAGRIREVRKGKKMTWERLYEISAWEEKGCRRLRRGVMLEEEEEGVAERRSMDEVKTSK
jgi:hypothetical protein